MTLPFTYLELISAVIREYGIGPVEAVTLLKGELDQALVDFPSEED
ncbi:hypothetical protein ES705_19564 [subsurface metagenome]